ncbi:MAG: tetratricopeptide repeat protein [Haliea sp.]|nr:tetratricopeptide repeat protein [Haliea sp.]
MLDLYNRYKRFELGLVSRWMFRNRRWEQAAELFSQLIDIDPDSPQSYRRLGDAYFRLGRWEDAEASYHSAVRLDSNDSLTFLHLGEVLA